MSGDLIISISPQEFDCESDVERSTFGQLSIVANDRLLTAGEDSFQRELRHGPHVAGYPIAEWFAWNWWRHRWEGGCPREECAADQWELAHRMPSIGEGYVWPNVTVQSDGAYVLLTSEATRDPRASVFRYLGAPGLHVVRARDWEAAIDALVDSVVERLENARIRESDLHRVWQDVRRDRVDPETARYRRMEARLGYEPGEVNEGRIRSVLSDAAALGEEAMGEIALDAAGGENRGFLGSGELAEIAEQTGLEVQPGNTFALADANELHPSGDLQAWKLGQRLASAVRSQRGLTGTLVADNDLDELAGAETHSTSRRKRNSCGISFALDDEKGRSRISLRSSRRTSRRFDLARLIGDRLLQSMSDHADERLYPATRSSSYRQKMQRAFAAELLCPFVAVDDMMEDDYSEERRSKVAAQFQVSPFVIQTQLLNNRRISPEEAPNIVSRSVW